MRAGERRRGAALVLVLIVTLLLGLIAATLAFTVTLDGLAARNVQQAALAEGMAEGALELAAAWAAEATAHGTADAGIPAPSVLGGIDADVTVTGQADGLVLTSVATVGRGTVRRTLTLHYDPAGRPIVEARP